MVVSCGDSSLLNYPITRKEAVSDTYFGKTIEDPYRWLEDDNSEETKNWVVEQNKITFDYLEKIPLRDKIKSRLTEIWNFEKYSSPFKKGNYYFFFKNDGIQNQSVLYFQKGLEGESTVLIDPNTLSTDGTIALASLEIRKDAKYAAYQLSGAGSDWADIHIMEIETGKKLEDHLKWIKFSKISWYGDGFFYSRYEQPKEGNEFSEKNQFHKIYYHRIGTKQDTDELVYEDKEHSKYIFNATVTDDENYLILYTSETTSGNKIAVKKLNTRNSEFVLLTDDFTSDYEFVDNKEDQFLILTNNNAPKYKLIEIDLKSPEDYHWKNIIPETEDVLEGVHSVGNKIFAKYLKDVSSKLFEFDMKGQNKKEIILPGLGIMGEFSTNKTDSFAFFTFTNYTTPISVFKFNIYTAEVEKYRQPEIKFNTEELITKQVFYTSKDGTSIPMYITHKKDIVLDGNNPTFLYGYGGFNISILPKFDIERAVFLENGGVYAVPNIRGGGEYGKEWHKAGTQLKKQNVFDDFIAAAEYLIAEKYTSKEKLAVHGRSNGGLLIGAVMTQRPDLFKVVLPKVGVLDMLRYHKFTIGYAWATDYGTSDDEVQFNNLMSYSPLHNVKEIEYPATLIMTGDHDDRVVPAHSFKFAAELQSKQKGKNPVLIRVDTNAGHGSGKPVSKQIEEFSDTWAFVFHHLGMSIK